MKAEPQLEDLSAYVDNELTGIARQELEAHLQTCETCRLRLDALRQTISAVQALPTEAPPRAFTIPPQRQQRKATTGWAWAGGAVAAACLLLVVTIGLANLPHRGGASGTAAMPLSAGPHDRAAAPGFKSATVSDPQNPSRQLTLSTGQPGFYADQGSTTSSQAAPAMPANGPLQVGLILQGVPGDGVPNNLSDAHVRLALLRDGYEVALANPETFSAARENGAVRITATFRLGSPPLPSPAAGSYVLRVTWQVPDGSGVSLVAQVPVTVTS